MDHMRISGSEPSSVIFGQTKKLKVETVDYTFQSVDYTPQTVDYTR